jgi:hypothetical protein
VLPAAEPPGAGARRLRLWALALAVLVVHLWVADQELPPRLGEGAGDHAPRRIDVAFVRELAQAAPPPAAPPAPPRRPPALASLQSAAPAASAPLADTPPLQPSTPEPSPALEVALEALPPAPVPTAALVASPTFEWPPSTRLSYTLTGDFRGPVQGTAQVEWLRSGTRYQVRMDVSAALLFSRHIISEGELTAEGLRPSRYDETTKVILREPRQLTVLLGRDVVRLAGGAEVPRPTGVQDSASQFVQMTWLFTTQPQLLERGRTVDIPLALPRRVETWTYEVLETETLATPAGPVQAVHVKPRRENRSNELVAEMWVAPSLQYLPVRMLIRQDAQTYIDLLIERLPQQAEAGR